MAGKVSVPLPPNSTIQVSGFTNSGGWGQQIAVKPPSGQQPVVWTGTGGQNNHLVGQITIPKQSQAQDPLEIAMSYNPGKGWQPSAIEIFSYEMPGIKGYVIGGQDGGGRPNGPAFWNTVVFIYWCVGY
ncbi:MAG TPA: hypothetical protein VFC63_23970 [Blastocatellia bacterium]|nr:hypothetical protein [Blastocatellia bacterium]